MNFILPQWHLRIMLLTSCINSQQEQVIEYLRSENAVLKERLGKKRSDEDWSSKESVFDPMNYETLETGAAEIRAAAAVSGKGG